MVGLVSQIFRPASATLLSELTPESRQVMIFAMYRFGLNVGTTAAPLLGYALYNLDHQRFTLLFWGEALVALIYAGLALVALPRRTSPAAGRLGCPGTDRRLSRRAARPALPAVPDRHRDQRRHLHPVPVDAAAGRQAEGVPVFWYTVAVALNGVLVIAFELPLTKLSQRWPLKLTVGVAMLLVGLGMGCYGLPLGPAVIILGTLIWTTAEVIGAPTVFAYPAMAGPAHLKGRYIGSFQFMFGLGTAVGPVVGAALFTVLGHRVWWVLALGALVSAPCAVAGVRSSAGSRSAANEPGESGPGKDRGGSAAGRASARGHRDAEAPQG